MGSKGRRGGDVKLWQDERSWIQGDICIISDGHKGNILARLRPKRAYRLEMGDCKSFHSFPQCMLVLRASVVPLSLQVGVYTSAEKPYQRTAIFPHGAKKKGIGVVSDRAIKHLNELVKLQGAGQVEGGESVSCAVIFLVNR